MNLEQRIQIVQIHYENGRSITETQRKFSNRHGIKKKENAPSLNTISNIIKSFSENGCVNKIHRTGRGKDMDLAQKLNDSYQDMDSSGDHITVSTLSEKAGCSKSTAHNFLRKDLHLIPYKITIGQVLSEEHKTRRLAFCNWMLGKINEDPKFLSSILWSDECSFKLSGYVNRQNFRFWGLEKPNMILQKPLMERRLNVFVAFNAKRVFGPSFLKMNMDPPLRLMVNDMLKC